MKSLFLLNFVLFMMFFAAPVQAEPNRGFSGHRAGGAGFFNKLASELELTEERRSAVDAIVKKNAEERRSKREQFLKAHEEVRAVIRKEPLDEAQARQAAKQAAAVHEEMVLSRIKTLSAIRGVLTPEQKEKMDELVQEARTKRQSFRGRRSAGGEKE